MNPSGVRLRGREQLQDRPYIPDWQYIVSRGTCFVGLP